VDTAREADGQDRQGAEPLGPSGAADTGAADEGQTHQGDGGAKSQEEAAAARAARITELAAMFLRSRVEYGRVRDVAAQELGLSRVADLDADVEAEAERIRVAAAAAGGKVSEDEDTGPRESQADALVKFINERCELVHDENGEVYAVDRETRELRHIEWRTFRDWVSAAFYEATGKAARAQSFTEAASVLAGLGRFRGELVDIHIRCARVGSGYAIDLGEPGNSRAILVDAAGWRIVADPGVRFLRPKSLQPLPEPVPGCDVSELWALVNIPPEARLPVLTYLLEVWHPDTHFPVLELVGEHGCAKTLVQKFLATLVDPSSHHGRAAPKSEQDVFVSASNGWLLAYDNISFLPPAMQDVFCQVATGGTHTTRQLHTNKEEAAIRAHRPVCINGIAAAITAQDLVDRTLSVVLPVITERLEEEVLIKRFEAARPRILGALLTVFSTALGELPHVRIAPEDRPRMLEFAKLGCAVARAQGMPQEYFLAAYAGAHEELVSRTIDASPVATALREWLEGRPERFGEHAIKALHETLKPAGFVEGWPRSSHGFGNALRRVAPSLRTFGIGISRGRKSNGHTLVMLSRISKKVPSGETSHSSHYGTPDAAAGAPADEGEA
jgi:hypothetical protein